jgi:hypothetical protein
MSPLRRPARTGCTGRSAQLRITSPSEQEGHSFGKEKIAIAESAWPRLHDEAARLRDTPVEQGTALDTAGNGRFARKVIVHCKHERARRLSARPPQLLAQATDTDLIVNEDDLRRAIAAALATN